MTRLLIIGARPGSLGDAVAEQLQDQDLITAGMSDEDFKLDVRDGLACELAVRRIRPASIIYTAGVNLTEGKDPESEMVTTMDVNLLGAVRMFEAMVRASGYESEGFSNGPQELQSFVTVSSNSAHVARSTSPAYCASKAALSMWTRCVGRSEAQSGGMWVWGYEPGWLAHSPMSRTVQARIPLTTPTHRIPGGGNGLDIVATADRIQSDWRRVHEHPTNPDRSLRATMVRCDGGDQ